MFNSTYIPLALSAILVLGCGGGTDENTDPDAGASSFSVVGDISFESTGDLYVRLVTKEQYETPGSSSPFEEIVGIGGAVDDKVPFAFDDVPMGAYTVDCFQDVNGDGMLNVGLAGPEEPWGNYQSNRPVGRAPTFEEVAFDLTSDLVDITVPVTL